MAKIKVNWSDVIKFVITILSAVGASLGASSCISLTPSYHNEYKVDSLALTSFSSPAIYHICDSSTNNY